VGVTTEISYFALGLDMYPDESHRMGGLPRWFGVADAFDPQNFRTISSFAWPRSAIPALAELLLNILGQRVFGILPTLQINAASDEKFVDCGRLFHAFIARWAKNRLRMLVQCDVYNPDSDIAFRLLPSVHQSIRPSITC